MIEKIGIVCLAALAAGIAGCVQIHYWKERRQAQAHSKRLEQLLEQTKIQYAEMAAQNRQYHEFRHDRRKYEWMLETMQQNGKQTRAQLVEHIFRKAEQEAGERDIAFEVEGQLTQEIALDELNLVRLFMNLLDNALEASAGAGQGRIRIGITEEPEAHKVTLRLQNTKREDRHLDENETGDGYISTKEDGASHGYGTQIIRRIVDENGGMIRYADAGNTMQITCELCTEDKKL